MSTIAAIDRRNQVVDALKQLLENLSDTPLREEYCEHCSFLMTHVSGQWFNSVPGHHRYNNMVCVGSGLCTQIAES